MLAEIGFTKGIENYSRHLSGAAPGEPPPTLVDYLKSRSDRPQDAVRQLVWSLLTSSEMRFNY